MISIDVLIRETERCSLRSTRSDSFQHGRSLFGQRPQRQLALCCNRDLVSAVKQGYVFTFGPPGRQITVMG